eukprot:g14533.t1
MARTGRTSSLATALVLLGLQQQGAWALPSSKVAFLQHGLAEGEDAVMHAPPAGSSRLSAITPQLLSSAIARVMSLDARAEVDTGLPAGDIFNRPDANLLVFVDGLRPTGSTSTPFMTQWLQEPAAAYGLRTPTHDGWTSGLESALGASFDVVHSTSDVICAAVDPALGGTEACSPSTAGLLVRTPEGAEHAGRAAEDGSLVGVTADTSTGLRTLVLSGAAEGEEDAAVLDLTAEADLRLVEELSFLSSLPAALSERLSARPEGSSPPLVIVYLSSLKAFSTSYGARSAKTALASKALDAALGSAFDAMSAGAGRRLTSQLIVGPALSEKLAMGGRRLQTDDDASSSNSTSLEDITQFQLNMWTGVGLALVGFLAIYATFTMDVQPDSLLFISVGDPYKELRRLPGRWKGKQFQTEGCAVTSLKITNGMITQDTDRYTKTQPLNKRQLGFGTRDAFKRGEFTAAIRTEQYREMLRQEQRLMDAARDTKAEQETVARAKVKHASTRTFVEGKEEIKYLYDVGRKLQNDFNPYRKHDSFYDFHKEKGKRMGPYRTMAMDIGNLAWDHRPTAPEFGPIGHIKNFYDRSHLAVAGEEACVVEPRARLR